MASDDIDVFETGLSVLFNEPEINNGDAGETIVAQFQGEPKITLQIPETGIFPLTRCSPSLFICPSRLEIVRPTL